MTTTTHSSAPPLCGLIASAAHRLTGGAQDYDRLLELIGDARFVLIGEASHGTQEFYEERARITRRLIAEKDFNAVAVEADWPDAYRVNRYVRGQGEDTDSEMALAGFKRFPTWMWRNTEVAQALANQRLERAIGVVYRPETERESHYFYACLPRQFDVILHFDETRAVEPLELSSPWTAGEAPETFPAGL